MNNNPHQLTICELCFKIYDKNSAMNECCPFCREPANYANVNMVDIKRAWAQDYRILRTNIDPHVQKIRDYTRYIFGEEIVPLTFDPQNIEPIVYTNGSRNDVYCSFCQSLAFKIFNQKHHLCLRCDYRKYPDADEFFDKAFMILFKILFCEDPVLALGVVGRMRITRMVKHMKHDDNFPYVQTFLTEIQDYDHFLNCAYLYMTSDHYNSFGMFTNIRDAIYRDLKCIGEKASCTLGRPLTTATLPELVKLGLRNYNRYYEFATCHYYLPKKKIITCKACGHYYINDLTEPDTFGFCERCGEIVTHSFKDDQKREDAVHALRQKIYMDMTPEKLAAHVFLYNYYDIPVEKSDFHPDKCVEEKNACILANMKSKENEPLPPVETVTFKKCHGKISKCPHFFQISLPTNKFIGCCDKDVDDKSDC